MRHPLCLAMGVFDGVHRGHQAVISAAVKRAARTVTLPAALIFEPHPDAILNPEGAPPLLTTTKEKLELLSGLGIGLAIIARFDWRLAYTSAEEFVRAVLVGRLCARSVVVGEGWHFGAGGRGTPELLQHMSASGGLGFRVQVVPSVLVGGRKVSSTRIRGLLRQGQVGAARQLLGRQYQMAAHVVAGAGLGRQLGYPTANLELPEEKVIPGDGVYACWACLRRLWPAVTYIGMRPTFASQGRRRMEVHLLDHGRRVDLLGRRLRVAFAGRLRGDRRFSSAEMLKEQLARDCARARRMLATLHA